MALRKTIKCPKCPRTFSMPGHLARHVNTIHSGKRRAPTGRANHAARGPVRRMPKANLAFSRMGLGRLSLEQLRDVIDAAKTEAKRRLRELQSAFQ